MILTYFNDRLCAFHDMLQVFQEGITWSYTLIIIILLFIMTDMNIFKMTDFLCFRDKLQVFKDMLHCVMPCRSFD